MSYFQSFMYYKYFYRQFPSQHCVTTLHVSISHVFPTSLHLEKLQKVLHISKSNAKIHKASAASSLFSGSALGKALDLKEALIKVWLWAENQEIFGDVCFGRNAFGSFLPKKNMSKSLRCSSLGKHRTFLFSSSTIQILFLFFTAVHRNAHLLSSPDLESHNQIKFTVCRTKKHHGSTIYPAVSLLITCNFNYP